jgi:hypothetical protein
MSVNRKGSRSKPWRDLSEAETPSNSTLPPPGSTFGQTFSGDLAMSMLLEMHRGVTELKIEVKHLTTATESLKAKVESLVTWKNAVFGGAAVLAILWGIFKGLAGYVHFGSKAEPSDPTSMRTTTDAIAALTHTVPSLTDRD